MNEIRTTGTRQRLIDGLNRMKTAREQYGRKDEILLTTGEVATLFRVSHRAVRTWADAGRLPYVRTLGGHRRFIGSEVWDLYCQAMRVQLEPQSTTEPTTVSAAS